MTPTQLQKTYILAGDLVNHYNKKQNVLFKHDLDADTKKTFTEKKNNNWSLKFWNISLGIFFRVQQRFTNKIEKIRYFML